MKDRRNFDLQAAQRHLARLSLPLDSRSGTLSGGQQAQVSLAIALGANADILLLDEPVASLDPLARSEFLALLRDVVSSNGTTALLSSHVISDIQQVCDYLIVLGVGRIPLDLPLREAIGGHVVAHGISDIGPAPPGLIGSYLDDQGARVGLFRSGGEQPPDARPATLDDVVKGYLSAGRSVSPGNDR